MKQEQDLYKSLSVGEIDQGIKGVFWATVVQMIKERIELIRTEIELGVVRVPTDDGKHYQSVALSFEDIKRRQGECSSLRYVIGLPQVFIDQKKEVQSNDSREEN